MSNENTESEFIDVIEDLGLDDPNLEAWDGTGTWQPITPGEYVLSVKDVKKHTSTAGKPSLNVTFEVASEGDALGKEIRHNYYSLDKSSKGFGRLVSLIRALGVATLPGGGLSIESMKGMLCVAEVYIEESQYFDKKTNAAKTGQNNRVKNEQAYEPPKAAAPAQPAKPTQTATASKPATTTAPTGKARQAVGQAAPK